MKGAELGMEMMRRHSVETGIPLEVLMGEEVPDEDDDNTSNNVKQVEKVRRGVSDVIDALFGYTQIGITHTTEMLTTLLTPFAKRVDSLLDIISNTKRLENGTPLIVSLHLQSGQRVIAISPELEKISGGNMDVVNEFLSDQRQYELDVFRSHGELQFPFPSSCGPHLGYDFVHATFK